MVAADPAGAPAPRIPPAAAVLLAFVVLALVNAVFIATLDGGRPPIRLKHHLVDAGHLLFVGATVGLAVAGWRRFGPRHPRWALMLLAALGVALAFAFVREDFAGFTSEAGGERGGPVLLAAMLVVTGLSPALVAFLAGRMAARGTRWSVGAALAGLAVAILNGLVLRSDYYGVHLVAALDAATAIATGLAGLPLPGRLRRAATHRFAAAWLVVVGGLSAPAVVLRPTNGVRTQLARVEGAILVPILARHAWTAQRSDVRVPVELAPWFEDRRKGASIPATKPGLLPDDPIVILVGIDSLRADLFDKPESRERMPRLLELQQRSLDFTMARSPGARTITTWSQVFAGRYVSGLRWSGDGNRLSIRDDRTPRFTDFLKKGGVKTSTFVSYGALGKRGLARTFDEVVDVKAPEGQSFALSTDVLPKMLEHLEAPHDGPRFVFAHWMDPHYPYDANGGTAKARGKRKGGHYESFLSEVELVDGSIGALWDALEAKGLLARTVLVVTADHGEAFGQHDTPYHTVTLYEELIRVPLFIVIPGVAPRRIDTPVSLMDLGPTFLDLFSLPTPSSFLGESLVPFARGETPHLTRPIGAERAGTRALVLGKYKVIVDKGRGRQEIYDLTEDPGELRNLADELGPEGARLLALVDHFFETHAILK